MVTFYHRKKYLDEFKMRFQKILIKDCRRLPIRVTDERNAEDRRCRDEIIRLVNIMLGLTNGLRGAKTEHDRVTLRWQIDETDSQIDSMVYGLYGLGSDEVSTIRESLVSEEGAVQPAPNQ